MHKLFATQREEEQIFLVIREHPVLPIMRLLLIFALFIIGILAHTLLPMYLPDIVVGPILGIFSLLMFCFYISLLVGALLIFIFWYLSLQIITDMRMVDVDQHGIFGRKVTELQIENVEEVTSKAHGFLATFFNFGHVLVQTSSAQNEFEFENVAHPEQVKKLILDLYEQRIKSGHKPTHI